MQAAGLSTLASTGVCDRMTTQSFQTTCSPSPRHLMLLDEVMSTSHGCVLPSVKHPTCREYTVALLTQQDEDDYKLQLQKDEENQLLQRRVKELEDTILRILEENLQLVSELKMCRGLVSEKEKELERQELEIQKERNGYEENWKKAEDKMQHLEDTLKSLEVSYVNMLNMAVDRELQLQEAEKKITLKEEETFKMEAEVAKLQEQRNGYEKKWKKGEDKMQHLEDKLKSLEVSYVKIVKMAVHRELHLQETQKKIA